ncbi:MAG: flippase-like domain-containing protein [bacterium]|nr:MAG: flippase-like domain-containing protein [bacterium]
MKKYGNSFKIIIGLLISIGFLFLAFRQLDFQQMKKAFSLAKYWLLLPSLVIIFASHWLRSVRWQFLLNSVKKIPKGNLFSALLIGYAANTILPAHLGEFLRAYVIGRKQEISVSSALATIVVERIIDVLSIVIIMSVTLIIYPFPDWVKKSGYIMFVFAIGLVVFLILMKVYTEATMKFVRTILKPFPQSIREKVENLSRSFLDGLKPMKSNFDYVIIFLLSILIWFCYWAVIYLNFYTFNLVAEYNLGVTAGFVLLVITTISVVVPSSPGYIGTYHWLCQISLELFHVPRAIGLTYAIVVHAMNFFPLFLVGFVFAWKEGIKFSRRTIGQDGILSL